MSALQSRINRKAFDHNRPWIIVKRFAILNNDPDRYHHDSNLDLKIMNK